ncbi:MAG: photosynthetic complex assembly protein PuhC, partial [Rubrivivax sp.]
MNARAAPPSPTLPLAAMGGLLLITLLVVAAVRWIGHAPADIPSDSRTVVATRELRFEDRADGGIDVVDARRNLHIATVAPGSNGFLRSALRGLVRERKRRGIGDELPFTITAFAGGRLALADPGTGRSIALESFGATNAGAFASLLVAAPATSKESP